MQRDQKEIKKNNNVLIFNRRGIKIAWHLDLKLITEHVYIYAK